MVLLPLLATPLWFLGIQLGLLDRGFWAGHTVYPNTKLTPERFVNLFVEFGTERMMINSSGDWGESDPLNVIKTAALLEQRGAARLGETLHRYPQRDTDVLQDRGRGR